MVKKGKTPQKQRKASRKVGETPGNGEESPSFGEELYFMIGNCMEKNERNTNANRKKIWTISLVAMMIN